MHEPLPSAEKLSPEQAVQEELPVELYVPAPQFEHAVFEFGEYFPAAQAVQVVAPVPFNVSVMDPFPQVAHAIVDCAEYFPAAQAVQVVAPVLVNVFVTDPLGQVVQEELPADE